MSKVYKCQECLTEIEERFLGGKCPICGHILKPEGFKIEGDGFQGSLAYKQLGVLLLDGSGSMKMNTPELITKAEAVSKSVSEFFEKMKQSTISNHFCFAIVNFAKTSQRMLDITETDKLDTNAKYNPVIDETGIETYLYTGLEEAEKIIKPFMEAKDDCIRSVVLVIMTDGMDMDMDKAKTTMRQLKETYGDKLTVTASFFNTMGLRENEKKKIMDFLGELVTDPSKCRKITSGEELRTFFIASMTR